MLVGLRGKSGAFISALRKKFEIAPLSTSTKIFYIFPLKLLNLL